MALHNRDIVLQSRAALQGKWGLAMGATVLYWILAVALSFIPYMGVVFNCLVGGPARTGIASFYLKLSRNSAPEIADVFSGFSNFFNALIAYLLYGLFVILWMLLLIVPGIIAMLTYSQVFYILADNPETSGPQALRLSREMMTGFRWKLFCLQCRYIGWVLLGFITLGIGFLWVMPMIYTALARFHDDVKAEYQAKTSLSFSGDSAGLAATV
jgi:uncharacterized membrane protein